MGNKGSSSATVLELSRQEESGQKQSTADSMIYYILQQA